MKKNKTWGIVLLVLAGVALLGTFANGTFSDMGNQNPGFYVGFFSGFALLIFFGLKFLFGKKE